MRGVNDGCIYTALVLVHGRLGMTCLGFGFGEIPARSGLPSCQLCYDILIRYPVQFLILLEYTIEDSVTT